MKFRWKSMNFVILGPGGWSRCTTGVRTVPPPTHYPGHHHHRTTPPCPRWLPAHGVWGVLTGSLGSFWNQHYLAENSSFLAWCLKPRKSRKVVFFHVFLCFLTRSQTGVLEKMVIYRKIHENQEKVVNLLEIHEKVVKKVVNFVKMVLPPLGQSAGQTQL